MNKKLFIPILLGTIREGRESEKVARLVFDRVSKHPEIETMLFDPRTMRLPSDNEGQALKFHNPEYRNAIVRADGLIIVSPEYNHGYPGTLKSVLDMLLKEYIHKAVGLVGVSAGGLGGARVIESLLHVVRELGMVATFTDVNVSRVGQLFHADGNLADDSILPRIDAFLEELVWMSKVLRWGRENLPSKFDEQIEKLEQEWREKVGNNND